MNLRINKPKTKAGLIAAIAITVVTTIGVGVLLLLMWQEPSATVNADGSLTISGMYGTTINASEISDITLVDSSMQSIGAGRRNNGSNGSVWRGSFEAGLLFVRPNASPTLRIDRNNAPSVFISFNDAAKTRELYRELSNR